MPMELSEPNFFDFCTSWNQFLVRSDNFWLTSNHLANPEYGFPSSPHFKNPIEEKATDILLQSWYCYDGQAIPKQIMRLTHRHKWQTPLPCSIGLQCQMQQVGRHIFLYGYYRQSSIRRFHHTPWLSVGYPPTWCQKWYPKNLGELCLPLVNLQPSTIAQSFLCPRKPPYHACKVR